MKAIRVRVENGRITGVAPPGLPDGEIELCIAEPDDMDEMTDAELAQLDESLQRTLEVVMPRTRHVLTTCTMRSNRSCTSSAYGGRRGADDRC